ncbi:MAG TPA: hypothetical protein DCE78_10765 [Bacteroidetes bacterium]|nr:hypothetical protein [Bacteroidota bacterium]
MGSIEDRERLKEEYKEHFRAIRDLRKKAAESERMAKISSALHSVNKESIMDSFDQALNKVRETIEIAEAKIEMAIEARLDDHGDDELREIEQKRKAKEALDKIRSDMGVLHNDLVEKVEEIQVQTKTLGPSASDSTKKTDSSESVKKSLGPDK